MASPFETNNVDSFYGISADEPAFRRPSAANGDVD
jgi:hypothetical protein